ncbi:MAG TPA: serine hydrolase, partial [Streptomyces sp.]|nr:serine hydrolase [Streptomyces sp.]
GTFGHFGQSGTFLWIDPVAGLACVALTDRAFGPWAIEAWTPFTDAVLAEVGNGV